MNTRTDQQHAHFARVRTRLAADLRSATAPTLTLVGADGQPQAGHAAPAAGRHRAGGRPAAMLVAPIMLVPADHGVGHSAAHRTECAGGAA